MKFSSFDYNKHEYLPDKKKSNSNETMLFWRKTDETIWNAPLFLRGSPPFKKPPISEQFFHGPPLCPNFKNKKPPLILGGGEEETMTVHIFFCFPIVPSIFTVLLYSVVSAAFTPSINGSTEFLTYHLQALTEEACNTHAHAPAPKCLDVS